jgi:hypothetical protein
MHKGDRKSRIKVLRLPAENEDSGQRRPKLAFHFDYGTRLEQ